MRYLYVLLSLILFVFVSCAMKYYNKAVQNEDSEKIKGTWVSESDTNSVLTFEDERVLKTYQEEITFDCSYQLIDTSCDSSYMDKLIKASFIKITCTKDNLCFEITGLSDTLLAYRETITGKLHVFKRLK